MEIKRLAMIISKVVAGIIGAAALVALYVLIKRGVIEFSDYSALGLLILGPCCLFWAFWDVLTLKSSL